MHVKTFEKSNIQNQSGSYVKLLSIPTLMQQPRRGSIDHQSGSSAQV
jgi:hypothetical protein